MGKLCNVFLSVGDVAVSLRGHDTGRLYVVMAEIGEFVLVADGKYRPTDNPKQKRRSHLSFVCKGNGASDNESIKKLLKAVEEQNAKRG